MLPSQEILKGCRDPEALEPLIAIAETVLRTWQPQWSPFVAAPVREEALERLTCLTELQIHTAGGRPEAERQRLLFSRRDEGEAVIDSTPLPVAGLEVEGNFLFDPVEPHEMRSAILSIPIENGPLNAGELGDLWIRGDRGAQLLCTPEVAAQLHGRQTHVRDVEIQLEKRPLDLLQLPAIRAPKRFTSVEASCRLDAIASAGFGLSRAKVVQQIRNGRLRLNWQPVRQASKDLSVGDRLQLQDRGSVEVLALERTKRDRWRVQMERR